MNDEETTVQGNRAAVARAMLGHALRLEIDARELSRRDYVLVAGGERLPHSGPGDRVRLARRTDSGPRLRSGARVRFEPEGLPPVPVRVRESDADTVEVVAASWLGSPIPPGRLVEDTRWILHSLRARLLAAFHGRHDELALAMLGIGATRRVRTSDVACDALDLNAEQREAVRVGLQPGVCLLHGPPGTGKTTTLAALVQRAVVTGRTVLCAAPSNVATDRLLISICERLENAGHLSEGRVVRLGNPSLAAEGARWRHVWDPWQIALKRVGASGDLGTIRDEVTRLLTSCTVLVTTVAQTHLQDLRRRFDVVVVDEAVMTSLPGLYHVATAAAKGGSLVLCGDRHQLPVVVRSNARLVGQLYAVDPFRLMRHASGEREGTRLVRLRTQYRMDSAITNLVNHLVYDGALITHESVRARPPLGRNLGGAHLVLVDSSGVGSGRRRVRRYGNRVHAQLIAKVLKRLGGDARSQTTAVLSRFRDQVTTIREVVPEGPGLVIDTVHALQGGEVDTIILDVSVAPEHDHLGDYVVDSSPDAVGTRLLTVALTRARRRVIVLADVKFLSAHPYVPESAMSRQILGHVAGHGVVIRAEDL